MKISGLKMILIAGLCTAASIGPPAFAGSPRNDIDAANARFGAAYDAHDANAIAALYTEHASVLPPGQDIATGRAAIAKLWGGLMDSGLKITSLQTVSLDQFGSAMREIGRFAGTVPGTDKQPKPIAGKYVVIWKRVHGKWMLDSDIWNLNQ
jgi:ketosteroid isomerase-like protein